MSKQKELLVILEEIELRYERSLADPYDPETCENSLRDVPLLVKALRRAMKAVELYSGGHFAKCSSDITAILNGERPQKEDLEEPGGKS